MYDIKFIVAVNPTTGQPDYSQQWIEYYRSVGQNDVADQIMQQMKEVINLFEINISCLMFCFSPVQLQHPHPIQVQLIQPPQHKQLLLL